MQSNDTPQSLPCLLCQDEVFLPDGFIARAVVCGEHDRAEAVIFCSGTCLDTWSAMWEDILHEREAIAEITSHLPMGYHFNQVAGSPTTRKSKRIGRA